jgi:hypothetical protein
MKRMTAVVGAAICTVAFAATMGGVAWGAGSPPSLADQMGATANCGCSTTTTTTVAPTTTTTTVAPTTTTTTTDTPSSTTTSTTTGTVPPAVQASSASPGPSSGTGTDSPAVNAAAVTPDGPSQLPFTGPDIRPFLVLGFLLVALGLFLLVGVDSGAHSYRRYRHAMREETGAP